MYSTIRNKSENEPRALIIACPSTHWGRVTHISVGKLTIIGSDNGLSPDRRPAIIWTNDGILLIGPLGTNFSEILIELIEIITFSFKKMRLKVLSAKRRPFCLGLNELKISTTICVITANIYSTGKTDLINTLKAIIRKVEYFISTKT